MEHFILEKNYEVYTVEIEDLTISLLKQYVIGEKHFCLYITENSRVIGIIGKKEIQESILSGSIVINSTFTFCKEDNEDFAREIYGKFPKFDVLPVISESGHILFEYVINRDAFYDRLNINYGLNQSERSEKIIVSLTSHGKRLDTVYLAIKSIMYQTMKPDKIVLYLDEQSGNTEIANEKQLIELGLEIKRYKKNYKAHCKYYYAMQDYVNDLIITIDDDIIYPDNVIEDLYKAHIIWSDSVIAHRAHLAITADGEELNAQNFIWEVSGEEPDFVYCATGVGGVLYPVGKYREAFLKPDIFMRYSTNQDDIWLMFVEVMTKTSVLALETFPMREVRRSQEEPGLKVLNLGNNENQKWLENLEDYYGITLKSLVDACR